MAIYNNENVTISGLTLSNLGLIDTFLPKELFSKIKKECTDAEQNNFAFKTDLSGDGVPIHYFLKKTKNEFIDFLKFLIPYYDKTFNYLSGVTQNSKNCTLYYDKPWLNIQKQNEFLPLHTHDGIFSYVLWVKIPFNSESQLSKGGHHASCFEIVYTNILGQVNTHRITLSEKDEGRLLVFPSKLFHHVYPFYNTNETRISISGNILFDTGILEEKKELQYD